MISQTPEIASETRPGSRQDVGQQQLGPRDQYEEIEGNTEPGKLPRILNNHWEPGTMRLVLLAAAITFIGQLLFTLFPFFVFAREDPTTCCVVGRVMAVIGADSIAPIFLIGLSILACGFSTCVFIIDKGLTLGTALAAFSLSQLLPGALTYAKHTLLLKAESVSLIVSGASFGMLAYPLFLNLARENDSRLFVAISFFSTLLLVFLFVSMLNSQAQTERTKATQDRVQAFISRFFSGETGSDDSETKVGGAILSSGFRRSKSRWSASRRSSSIEI
ncbi:unnamed protein product, partial [Mesorhabditis spiculigera]